MREEVPAQARFDAGEARQALTAKAKEIINNGEAMCYSELYAAISHDISLLSVAIGQSTAYVALCLVDDLEADLDPPIF